MKTMLITLRPICPNDEAFLLNVYASTRLDELAPLGWTAAQQMTFLTQQFTAQRQHYQTHYADADFQVILLDDISVGRLYVARWAKEIRLIDIALLSEYRNAGIGTLLLQDILAEAMEAGKRVCLHVGKFNPALRLYERLGFSKTGDQGIYWSWNGCPIVRKVVATLVQRAYSLWQPSRPTVGRSQIAPHLYLDLDGLVLSSSTDPTRITC